MAASPEALLRVQEVNDQDRNRAEKLLQSLNSHLAYFTQLYDFWQSPESGILSRLRGEALVGTRFSAKTFRRESMAAARDMHRTIHLLRKYDLNDPLDDFCVSREFSEFIDVEDPIEVIIDTFGVPQIENSLYRMNRRDRDVSIEHVLSERGVEVIYDGAIVLTEAPSQYSTNLDMSQYIMTDGGEPATREAELPIRDIVGSVGQIVAGSALLIHDIFLTASVVTIAGGVGMLATGVADFPAKNELGLDDI
jgi:hypothetical protein